jgi:uncharacterized protein
MIARNMKKTIDEIKNSFKSITILGPRQTGKTTLAKMCFPDYTYFNFENADTREMALSDPRYFFKQTLQGAIFDEIQRVPELLSYAQEYLDNSDKKACLFLQGATSLTFTRKYHNHWQVEPLYLNYCP